MAFDLGEALKNVSNSGTGREQLEYIRLDLIDSDPNNFYQLSDIDELAANIELCGLQQPVRVRPNPENSERYMIVSGHRRRAALERLAKDDPERWQEVPCIVSRDVVSPALQQLQLIFANSNTRKMTDSEIATQAAQTKKLLYQLKEDEGFEFPGRMRDHVAEIVKISKSKLARLEAIDKKLAAAWQPVWKEGTLPENTAYELSKMPKAYQTLLFEEKSRTDANLKFLYADDVKKFAERATAIVKQSCSIFGGDCGNYENKMRKAAVADRYYGCYCDSKCCGDCEDLLRCKKACPKLADTVKKRKADNKAANKAAEEAQARKDKPKIDQISSLWQRFGLAREMALKEFDDCKKAMDLYSLPYDSDKMMRLECGEEKITADTNVPFGYYTRLAEVTKYIGLADLLDCSIDYLFCRTDVKEMAQASAAVSESDTDEKEPVFIPGAWYPATVEPPVGVQLVLIDAEGYVDDGIYKGCGEFKMYCLDAPVILWTLKPNEKDAAAAAPAPTGWRSGTPKAYGTYAAYVQIAGGKRVLRELLWTGDEWLLCGSNISECDVKVICWSDVPEF